MTGGSLSVRSLTEDDLSTLAAVHRRAFPSSVLGDLGPETLRRYYQWQLFGPHEVQGIAVLDANSEMVGFLIGGVFHGSTIGFVKRNPGHLIGRVVRSPKVLFRADGRRALRIGTRLLARRMHNPEPEQPERVPDRSFGVLVLAVDPGTRRNGVGSLLLDEAERCARRAGLVRMHLTLDPSNETAMQFYKAMGWDRLGLPGDTDHQWLMGRELDPED